jgi:hypothetical protein
MNRSPAEVIRFGFDQAFSAYQCGDINRGDKELVYVLQRVPCLRNDKETIAREIITRLSALVSNKNDNREVIHVAQMACAKLSLRVRHYVMSSLHEMLAFRNHQRGAFRAARTDVLRSIAYDWRKLSNRGLISVLAESYLESAFMKKWRHLKRLLKYS